MEGFAHLYDLFIIRRDEIQRCFFVSRLTILVHADTLAFGVFRKCAVQ